MRQELAGHYSRIGRPSIDPELMIRMLIVDYCFAVRSERRLCEEIQSRPKFISPYDPAAQWTGAPRGPAFFAYATNYLIDTQDAVIVDVEATQAEHGAARTIVPAALAFVASLPLP